VPDLIYRNVRRFLTSAGNENRCAFMREAPGGRKADTGAPPCYQGNLPSVFRRVNVEVRRGVIVGCLVKVIDQWLKTSEYWEVTKGASTDSLFTDVHNEAQ
jgi:hypothetical protein